MIIVVSDTSVLVDLERGHCLEACFKLPDCEFIVPDLLYKRELAEAGGPQLCKLGLKVEALSSAEVSAAQTVRQGHPKLSLPDAYAIALARSRTWTLLTGDGELRGLAKQYEVEMHGVLWVFDQLFQLEVLDGSTLVTGLTAASKHPRCRLPKADVQARLTVFAKSRP
jgi:hypothetical protein